MGMRNWRLAARDRDVLRIPQWSLALEVMTMTMINSEKNLFNEN